MHLMNNSMWVSFYKKKQHFEQKAESLFFSNALITFFSLFLF